MTEPSMNDPMALNDHEIDKVANFTHHLYQWAFKGEPANIADLIQEYEGVVELFTKGAFTIDNIVRLVRPDPGTNRSLFDDIIKDVMMKRNEWVENQYGGTLLPRAVLEEVLTTYHEKKNKSPLAARFEDDVSWMDIRNEIKRQLQIASEVEREAKSKNNDPLISEYETSKGLLNINFIDAIKNHPDLDLFRKDKAIRSALNTLAAVNAWQNSEKGDSLERFYTMYLKQQDRFPGAHIFSMSVDDALNRVDEVLIAEGIGDNFKTQIMRKFESTLNGNEQKK